jgi:hypothetical protein
MAYHEMINKLGKALAGTLVVAFLQPAQAQEPKVEQVIARYLEAIGGIEANRKLKTRKIEGTMVIAALGTSWKMTVIQQAPDKKFSRVDIPDAGPVLEGCDGTMAWKKEPGQALRKIAGQELVGKLSDARFHGVLELMTEGNLSYLKRAKVQGRMCHVLKGTVNGIQVSIDEASHLLRAIALPGAGGGESPGITIHLSEHRKVDGVQVPFAMAMSVGPEPLLKMTFDKVTHGVDVDAAIFALPAE